MNPAWIRCECCEDYLCTLHPGEHVADCPCPDLDDWAARGLNPYVEGGPEKRPRKRKTSRKSD